MFLVRQIDEWWQVVQVPLEQGRAMRERGDRHVYDTASQAYAVREKLLRKAERMDPATWIREELLPALRGADMVDERTLRRSLRSLAKKAEAYR